MDGMGTTMTDKRAASYACKRGFTLMELMVYIAIVGIVVIVAGQAFSNSTKMRVRTQSMLKASEVAENVASLFKQDIAQTGAKSSMEAGTTDDGNNFGDVHMSVYMDPLNSSSSKADFSSYKISASSNQSDLTVRRLRYNSNGRYAAVEEVRWYVEGKVLKRSCLTIEGTGDADNCPTGTAVVTDIADGVDLFTVTAGKPDVSVGSVQVFPPCSADPCPSDFNLVPRVSDDKYVFFGAGSRTGKSSIRLSQFFTNYVNTDEESVSRVLGETDRRYNQAIAIGPETISGSETWMSLCQNNGGVTLEENMEYELSFSVNSSNKNKSQLFVPGEDHISVGFIDPETGLTPQIGEVNLIDDFLFFPPLADNGSGKRSVRFSVPATRENICIAFTFACYSPLVAQGEINISGLKLKKIPSSSYKFEGTVDIPDKKNVKALKLDLKIKKNGEAGALALVVPIPSNGPTD